MKILVCGADGYLGWPLSLHFAAIGHEVVCLDNYLKRELLTETSRKPLWETPYLGERISKVGDRLGKNLTHVEIDLRDFEVVHSLIDEFRPDAIVHFAEQPSAPYSMMGFKESSLTLQNNLVATHNLLEAIRAVDKDIHLIKLGTMGEYGTPNIRIEEGFIDIDHLGRKDRFLFPRAASSLYHTTKVLDTDLVWFYVRVHGLRVTDLMQGPVYGVTTPETRESGLLTSFHYDDIFGTVLNRFMAQAIAGVPLTVYGNGSQKRGYLDIVDSMRCIELSALNPPNQGELNIHNQFTEVFSVNELADLVVEAAKRLDLNVEVEKMTNPRFEAEDHYYEVAHDNLKSFGWQPIQLTVDYLVDTLQVIQPHADDIDRTVLSPTVGWSK